MHWCPAETAALLAAISSFHVLVPWLRGWRKFFRRKEADHAACGCAV